MKLYYSPGACSLSPHIVLEEAGLPYEAIRVDLKTHQTANGSDYKKVNPLGYVPLLELDDGTKLTEGPSIVQYLADKAPAKKLAPASGTIERAQVQSWLNFIGTELHKGGFSMLFNPKLGDDAKAMFRERLLGRLAHLDQHLAKSPFMAGDAFSVADAYAFTVLNWSVPMKIDLGAYPNVKAYLAKIAARDGVQRAMKQEGLIKS
jgi:glutathione S-transferase